ncbi:MAG: N-6 DNA methylase [Sulfurospirillum sp.]|nr:N-6 DNA methylase [Sulfurospirillum sp.]
MQIFQKRVLSSYVEKQDEKTVTERWSKFQKFKDKIFSIKKMKEEKYQDGFLTDIFENCLGYTKDTTNPDNYNLEREKKNESDSRKVDGAISVNGNIVGYIELKGQNKKDLDKSSSKGLSPVDQAFRYMYSNNSDYGKYVIVSNFDELRFYIKNKTNYEKFSLFNMCENEFKKLHVILSYESIKKDLPLEIKEKSVTFEVDISNKFYKDYALFRSELFNNILKNNTKVDKLVLLNQTQKLIDRIVFILFAEDTTLLPFNTIPSIIKNYQNDVRDGSLYEMYKIYFNAINKGSKKLNINEYNGGLFKNDEALDSLKIDDEVLNKQAKILSAYNFGSDISVNILGHIFEQSISDLEELTAQINEDSYNKKQSKRKKDGIFYTPAYITDYIVENTLGKKCREKREELNLLHVEKLASDKKVTKKITQQKKDLTTYKKWITNLKILDPACGSGAFLNQALEFLLKEHKTIQEEFKNLGDIFAQYQVDKTILENNLYGVDINESAVEIAKLSLWLKTADNKRPLTKLANKIKCGNSLTTFKWEDEFSEVFEQSGFDIVIGNPPYIMEDDNRSAFIGLYDKPCYQGKTDIWHIFTCKAISLTKDKGLISFIAKNQWLNSASASKMRKNIYDNTDIKTIIDFGANMVFENVGQQTMIFILEKSKSNKDHNIKFIKYKNKVDKNQISQLLYVEDENIETSTKVLDKQYDETKNLTFSSSENEAILKKIDDKINFKFDEKKEIIQGIIGGPDKAFIVKKDELNQFNSKEKEYIKMFHTNTQRYSTKDTDKYVFYVSKKNCTNDDIEKCPSITNILSNYKKQLDNRREVLKNSIKWFHLWWARDESFFKDGSKIIFTSRTKRGMFTYTDKSFYGTRNLFFIKSSRVNLKYITALLNSKLMYFYMEERLKHTGDLLQIDKNQFMKIPLFVPDNIEEIESLVNSIIKDKETIVKYNKHFDGLNAVEKIELKEAIEKLETNILNNDNSIDKLIYKLYKLSDYEIDLVEKKQV